MKKTFILDTSALINDPNCFKTFIGNEVIIPINVLDELDKLKTFPNEAGKNARVAIRQLDALCSKGAIHKGIKIDNNITLKIDTTQVDANKFGSDSSYVDNKILACAFMAKQKNDKKKIPTQTVLVSRDINLRIRARAYDILAESYEKDGKAINEMYQGFVEIKNAEIAETLTAKSVVDCGTWDELKNLLPNECVYAYGPNGKGAIGRKIGDKLRLIQSRKPWGLDLRSKEQAFAVDLLCDKKLPLVTLMGKAGTGKSLVALAAALEMVAERKEYNKLIIYRPIQSVGKDVGYLPGTLEKIGPYFEAIYDNLEVLFGMKSGDNWKRSMDYMMERGIIEMDAVTFIRGRSISNALIIFDEAQQMSKEDIKTVLTRVGEGSKIVLTGDLAQIDNSNLDAMNNGLSNVIEKFKDSHLAGHITFTKGERSELATLAANIL